MIWLWLGLAVIAWCVAAIAAVVVYIVGRQSLERRGVIVFDTPEARLALRSALKRCNPVRDVHYFGGQPRCECGKHTYQDIDDELRRAQLRNVVRSIEVRR